MDWLDSRLAYALPIACVLLVLPSCSWWERRENRGSEASILLP